MKTKVVAKSLILFLLAIFTLVLVGCKKEDPPTLSVEIEPTQVVYNGSATLTWQSENLAWLKINGTKQSNPDYGLIILNNLTGNTTYNFVGLGLDGSTISRSVSIEVGKPAPKLTVTVNPDTVITYKGSATVNWQGENLASLTANNVTRYKNDVNRYELVTGSIPLTNLLADTTFNFVAIGLDGSTINQSVEVKVAEPTRTDTLCGNYWIMTEWKYFYEGGYWFVNLTDDDKAKKTYFSKKGRITIVTKDGKIVGDGNWSWVGQDSIKMGRIHRYELTESKFVRSQANDSIIITYKGFPL